MKNRNKEVIINMNELCNIIIAKITDNYVTKGTIYHIKGQDDFGFLLLTKWEKNFALVLMTKILYFCLTLEKVT